MIECVEFNLRHVLLLDAFEELKRGLKRMVPGTEISQALEDAVDAFTAYAEGKPNQFAHLVSRHVLFRPFLN